MNTKTSYFLIAVSTRENLDLCIKYAMAGFTSSSSGVWSYEDIKIGDYVSFLYGARIFNLYQVKEKFAIKNAEHAPPWKLLQLRSGRTYSFPFRLALEPIRKFTESLVRIEFAYVAENLLLRGGYRKTHFQADQTTLQSVSQIGKQYKDPTEKLDLSDFERFTPQYTFNKEHKNVPEIFLVNEKILQAAIRAYLSSENNLKKLLEQISVSNMNPEKLEILSEKAFPEGHIDLLIKECVPIGISKQIIIETKKNKLRKEDITQLKRYMNEIKDECIAGVLIAKKILPSLIQKIIEENTKLSFFEYSLEPLLNKKTFSFNEIVAHLSLKKISFARLSDF